MPVLLLCSSPVAPAQNADFPRIQIHTGGVPRTVGDRLSDTIEIKDFGCVLNGVADDSTCLENAINAADGRTVRIRAGTLLVTRRLTLAVTKYALQGERDERGANAIGFNSGYATTVIRYRPQPSRVLRLTNAVLGGVTVFTTSDSHRLLPHEQVNISGLSGKWSAANGVWGVKALSATTFSIGLNSSDFGPFPRDASAGVTEPMIVQYPANSGLNVVGPYKHSGLTFDLRMGHHGFFFGDPSKISGGMKPQQEYTFGVLFKGCSFEGPPIPVKPDATGHITRSGQTMIQIAESFETVIEDVSTFGGDTPIRLVSCDRPMLSRLRLQNCINAISLEIGDLGVQQSLSDVQVEDFMAAAIRTQGDTTVRGLRSEKFQSSGGGRKNLTTAYGYTAAVSPGSNTLVFSASMDGVLLPGLSTLHIFNSQFSDNVFVTSVAGRIVTIADTNFSFVWTDSAASVELLHGAGVIGQMLVPDGVGVTGASIAALGGPAFVYAPVTKDAGPMSIAQAHDPVDDHSVVASGNHFGAQFYLNQLFSFSDCSVGVVADPSHPLVFVHNWTGVAAYQNDRAYEGAYNPNSRTRPANRFEEFLQTQRKWLFSPKSASTVLLNTNLVPFIELPGETPGGKVWAWALSPGKSIYLPDSSLPADTGQNIRIKFRARMALGEGRVALKFEGLSEGSDVAFPLQQNWATVEYIAPVPAQWTAGNYRTTKGIVVEKSTGLVYFQALSVELLDNTLTPRQDSLAHLRPDAVNGSMIYCIDCDSSAGSGCTSSADRSGAQAIRVNGKWKCY